MRLTAFRFLITSFALVSLSLPLWADRYKDWIQKEVVWIASKREVAEFKELSTDAERETFISTFWQRRDPTPATERNEYKEQHYSRLKFASQRFREGIAGWRTDRGRVHILHGPPDRIDNLTSDRHSAQDAEIWTYFSMPAAQYSKGRLLLVFEPTSGMTARDLTLGESRQAREKGQELYNRGGTQTNQIIRNAVRYRLVSAGPPGSIDSRGVDMPNSGIGEYARYTEDVMRSPGELLESTHRELDRQASSRAQLREEIQSKVFYDHLPLSMSSQTFYPAEGGRLSVAWQIPFSEIGFQSDGQTSSAKLDVMAQLRDEVGTIVDEFFKVVDLVYGSDDLDQQREKTFHYLNEFAVDRPGIYQVSSVVRDVGSSKLGSATETAKVTVTDPAQITLSDLVVSSTLVDSAGAIMGRDLITDQWQVIPESDGEFARDDNMVLFFKIYNAQAGEDTAQPDVVVNYDFLRDGKVFRTSGPRRLSAFSEVGRGSITFSSIIDLADFTPGDYIVQVNAIDLKTRKYRIERSQFKVQ